MCGLNFSLSLTPWLLVGTKQEIAAVHDKLSLLADPEPSYHLLGGWKGDHDTDLVSSVKNKRPGPS